MILTICLVTSALPLVAVAGERLLILPFHVDPSVKERSLDNFALYVDQQLRSTIEALGTEISVVSKEETSTLLVRTGPPAGDPEALELASRAGVGRVVYGFLRVDNGGYRFRGTLFDLVKGTPVSVTDFKANDIHGLPRVLGIFLKGLSTQLAGDASKARFYRTSPPGATAPRPERAPSPGPSEPNSTPWRSTEINGALRAIDVGDLDGDGRNETVFLDQAGVTVSRFEADTLKPLARFSEPHARYLSAEIADLDRDGRAELLISYQTPTGIDSAIASFAQGALKVVCRAPHRILRTVPDPSNDEDTLLVGQKTDSDEMMFSGEMIRYRFEDSKLVTEGTVNLPPGTLLLSQVSGRLGRDSAVSRAIINQDQRLMVFDGENRLLSQLSDRIFGLSRTLGIPFKGRQRDVTFPGRLLIADTDGSGENQLLVVKEGGGGCVILGLSWDGKHLQEKWRTVRSPGAIADFVIRPFMNNGRRQMVLILVLPQSPLPFFGLSGPRSVVYAYDLSN
ncbi:MAG: VCBS repeat-containing protein [Thermodesulfobacteriota bacterium]